MIKLILSYLPVHLISPTLNSPEVVGWPKAPAARVHTTIGGLRFGLGLARTA